MNDHEYRRERILDGAVASGRFPESRRQHYRASYDADPGGTERLIETLEPVPEIPAMAAARGTPEPELSIAATLFPELRRPRPIRYGGTPPVARQQEPVALGPPAPPRASAAAAAAAEVLTDEVVAFWSSRLFPEAIPAGAPHRAIVMAND